MDPIEDKDFDIHWHLYPGDHVEGGGFRHKITEVGIYRIGRDGSLTKWGPVAPEDRCKWCMAEFKRAVAP